MAVDTQAQVLPWESVERTDGAKSRRARQKTASVALGVAGVVAFLALWEAAGAFRWVNPLFISSPVDVFTSGVELVSGHQFWIDMKISGSEFLVGYLLAVVAGISLAVVVSHFRTLSDLISPMMSAFYATPRVALIPLIIVWFGIAEASKAALVFLMAFFPIFYNTLAGLANVDPVLVRAARSFGASPRKVLFAVALPSAVPFVLAGLRLAVGNGVVGVVVGELYAANAGIGYLIANAGQTLRVADSFVGIVVVALSGGVMMALLQRVERRFSNWKPDH